jgi:rubrerythrin
MNPKGPSLVDFEPAEPASTRRSLIGAAGAAGLVGAAAALLGGAPAAAAAPNKPTSADKEALAAALALELTARDLYREAATALNGDAATLAGVVAENHEAYASSISGATGFSADQRNDDIFDALQPAFSVSDDQEFARAARDLENTAVATHTALLGSYESLDAIELTVSIIATEARQAAVFVSMAGFASNLDDMLTNPVPALELTGGVA